ncbi:MAG TPA: hypothetical protein VKF63_10365 [Terracidiphilus sp.]|nr:hypothetical protein [Terracidiphilus sp.]
MGEDQHPHYRYPSFKAVPVKDGGDWSTVLEKNTTALSVKPRR